MPEELPTTPPAQQPEPGVEKKRKESSLLLLWWMRMLLFFRTWLGWLTIGLVATLLVVTTTIPVGRLPFLRNIVYAMGYSSEEAANLTFFKAFLGWNEHAKIARGELPDPNAVLVFGRDGGFLDAANRKGAATSSLINFQRLYAAQARQNGKRRVDMISGVADNAPGANKSPDAIALKGSDVSAQTQANEAGVSEVFFGDDSGMIQRNPKDAYNSTQNLKRLASAKGIIGGGGTNTLGLLIDRAVRVDSNIDSILQAVDSSNSFGNLGNIMKLGSDNPGREDLYYAWLLSRAARRARQASLQKKLASMAYMGGELPRYVFVMGSSGGLGFNPDEFEADMERMKDYFEQDEKCEKAINNSNTAEYQATVNNMVASIKQLVTSFFPENCGTVESVISSFRNNIGDIQAACRSMQAAYQNIGKECGAVVSVDTSQCYSPAWLPQVNNFNDYCIETFSYYQQLIDEAIATIAAKTDEISTLKATITTLEGRLANLNTQLAACEDDACRAGVQSQINAVTADKEQAEKDKKQAEDDKAQAEKDKKKAEEDKENAKNNNWTDSHKAGKTDLASNSEVQSTIGNTYYEGNFDVANAGGGERGQLRGGYFPTMTGFGRKGRDY